jgi:hypothetical protein
MIRMLSRLLSGVRRTSSPPQGAQPSSTSSASTTDEDVGPVDPLDPMKRDERLPGLDPVVEPIPPES